MNLLIRPLEADDQAAWRRLWTAYLAFYDAAPPEAVFATTFGRLLDPAEPMRALLALREGTPIGLAHVIEHRHGWSVGNVLYLQDLFVDEAARGTGAGRALIEAVYAIADAGGHANVYWLTQQENARARLLYDRIGRVTPFIKYQRR